LTEFVKQNDLSEGYDDERDTVVADIEALREETSGMDNVVFEGHLAHHLDADFVVVLRCRPDVLEERLVERGENEAKASENAESEALDIVLGETLERHDDDAVYELDTTGEDRTPDEVANEIVEAVENHRSRTGIVDWFDYIEPDTDIDTETSGREIEMDIDVNPNEEDNR
ncbi:MAG: AAA family ATPase, partial [Halobacteria archaeon]|nr:AAA family ATPase [Halobacteria archaeon]